MSFIQDEKGITYTPGYFIANGDERITRVTKTIAQEGATETADGTKYVKAGTAYPSNDGNAIGILYEDVDVTTGNMPGSVIIGGATIIEDRLPVALAGAAKSALEALGFKFVASAPAVTRPY